MKEMKALEILKACREKGQKRAGGLDLNEAIAELEALQQRSCEGCKREAEDMIDPHCAFCSRACNDNYEAKEQL